MVQENQRGFFGIIIPKEVLDDDELSITEKFIYGYIASFRRYCVESNLKIADKLGLSVSTIKHTIPILANKGYLFIEKPNGNNNARIIYSVLDNPKKLAYLAKKGMFDCEKPVENSETVVQNMHHVVQNMHHAETGVRSAKFAHIDIRINKNKDETAEKSETERAGSAGLVPAGPLPKRSDYETDEEFEAAMYGRVAKRPTTVGAN